MSDILVLMVMFRGEGSLNLYYEQTVKAHEAWAALSPNQDPSVFGPVLVEARDDFGTRVSIDVREVRAVILQNMQEHTKVAIEIQLTNARANAALQKRQMSDPRLRFIGSAAGIPNGGLIS